MKPTIVLLGWCFNWVDPDNAAFVGCFQGEIKDLFLYNCSAYIANYPAPTTLTIPAVVSDCPAGYAMDSIVTKSQCALNLRDYYNGDASSSSNDGYIGSHRLFDENAAPNQGDSKIWKSAYRNGHDYSNVVNNYYTYYSGITSTLVNGSSYAGEWVQINLKSFIQLKHYVLFLSQSSYSSLGYFSKGPTSFILVGSNNTIGWTLMDKHSNVVSWTSSGFQFQVMPPFDIALFMFFRIIMLSSADTTNGFVALSEWLLFPFNGNNDKCSSLIFCKSCGNTCPACNCSYSECTNFSDLVPVNFLLTEKICFMSNDLSARNAGSFTIIVAVSVSTSVGLLLVILLVVYIRRKRNNAVNNATSSTPESLDMHQLSPTKIMYDIFISLRFSEKGTVTGKPWKPIEAATLLKKALIAQGYSVFLCAVENGDSILDAVASALANSRFYIILASETYGTQTASLCSTYQEMIAIVGGNKPYFLIKMCDSFEVDVTRLTLHDHIMFTIWKPYNQLEASLPHQLIDEIKANYQKKVQQLSEF